MQLLAGYVKPVLALAFCPDGTRLYSTARGQQRIWVWDVTAGAVLRKLPRQPGSYGIAHLAVSPDGHLVSGGALTGVFVWPPGEDEPREPAERVQLLHPRPALALSPGGRLFAAVCVPRRQLGARLRLWPLDSGAHLAELTEGAADVTALAFAGDAGPLASVAGKQVRLWGLTALEMRCVLEHESAVEAVAFCPGGQALAAYGGGSVHVWDVKGRSRTSLAGHAAPVTALAYSPDGKHLAVAAGDGTVTLYDATTHEVAGRKHLDVGTVGALAWRPDSSGLAAGGDRLIALCDASELLDRAAKAKPRPRGGPLSLAGHGARVEQLAYSPDGWSLASSEKREVRLWDLSSGAGQAREKATFRPDELAEITSLSWSGDGGRLALRWPPQTRDGAAGALLRDWRVAGVDDRHLCFLPSGRLLRIDTPADESGYVRLWLLNGSGEKEIASATTPPRRGAWDAVHHVDAGPDGRNVYLSFGQKSVLRWDTAMGEVATLFTQGARVGGLRVRGDERQLATLAGNSVLLWGLPEGGRQMELKHPQACSGAAYLPGGRLLTSCYDGLVRVWDLSGGAELLALDLGMGKVYGLAVSPDHMTFAAAVHNKNRIVLMDVPE